jgi:hypothetical protein
MQPELPSLGNQPLERAMRLPDLCGQLFDIAAGRFGVDARLAGILQFDLDTLKVDHIVPLSSP